MKHKKIYWIEFIGDRSIMIDEGQSILQASLKAGIPHYHACGGIGQCSTCRILVKDGAQHLSAVNDTEKELNERIPFPPNVRLACQTYVKGAPISVHRIIRDEADIALYIDNKEEKDVREIGEEKELALFFLDIRDFTPFMQSYLPFDVIHIMRRLFTLFRKCIEENKGRVIETAGDGLYAVFGMDDTIQDASKAGIKAGYAILEELEKFNTTYMQVYFNHYFEVGMGLHAGRVITGNIGIGINNNLTVMGLPVNIASRLQTATKEMNNSFIVSNAVMQYVEPNGTTDKATYIKLKGINGKVQVYLLGQAYKEAPAKAISLNSL